MLGFTASYRNVIRHCIWDVFGEEIVFLGFVHLNLRDDGEVGNLAYRVWWSNIGLKKVVEGSVSISSLRQLSLIRECLMPLGEARTRLCIRGR